VLVARVLSEPSEFDVLLLTVLTSMCHNFISVRTNIRTLQAVEVRRFVVRACKTKEKVELSGYRDVNSKLTDIFIVRTVLIPAVHICSELFKVVAHQLIETLVTCSVLHESSLVTERVEAVFATAVEVRLQENEKVSETTPTSTENCYLVVAIAAVGEVAILIESELQVPVRHGIIFVRLFLILLWPF
jgi:hypothetical protein